MAIPSRQIGWGTDSNLLWQISKQLEYLTKVTGTASDVTVINDITDPVPVTVENTVKPYKYISLASTNATVIRNVQAKLYVVSAIGLTSTVRYLKFYDKAIPPKVGTDTPFLTIPVPANTQGAGIVIPFNIHIFHPSKFDMLKVNLQIIEHFVYGVATLEGHKLMDNYKLSTHHS
jgi:hypothetical protein